jgi:hypothetical protein
MSEALPDRDDEMLARLAEFDLAAAERVHGRLMAAEETSEIAELGRTYQRIARSLRQTLALKAKLKRDRQAADAAPAGPKTPPGGVAVARRLKELRAAVTRIIWNEYESPDDATLVEEELDDIITREMLGDGFCDENLDDHVARLCLELDLGPAAAETWRDLPDPPDEAGDPDAPPDRMSSA